MTIALCEPETALCQCGCGDAAPIANDSWAARGRVKGEPQKYIYGHYRPKEGDVRYQRRLGFESYEEVDTGYSSPCWVFFGKPSPEGYGRLWVSGRGMYAHRAYYEHYVGPVPTGAHLDHLCRIRICVRPSHLDPVTCRENIIRGVGASAKNAAKTHCIRNHEFTPENTYIYVTSAGGIGRNCKQCRRDREKDRKRTGRVRGRLRAAVIARDGYICGICAGSVEPDDVHIDHVLSRLLGGPTVLENLQVTHSLCNIQKGAAGLVLEAVTT